MKKILFLIVFLLFSYFFGTAIVTFSMGKIFCYKCEKIFSTPFEYKKADLKNGKFYLHGLASREDFLKVGTIEIDYHFHLKKKFIDFEIVCFKPQVKIKKNNGFSTWNLEEKSLFKYPITLKEGMVEFAFLENNKRLYFSLMQKPDQMEQSLFIWSDPVEKLELKYTLKGKGILAQTTFKNLSIKKFSFLEEKLLSQVEGVCSGSASFFLDEGGPKLTQLVLDVSRFAFVSPLMDWKLMGEKMHMENTAPFTLTAKNSLKLKASFDELFLKTTSGKDLLEHIKGTVLLEGIKADIAVDSVAITEEKKERLHIKANRNLDEKWICDSRFPLAKVFFEYDFPHELHMIVDNVDPSHFNFFQNLLGNVTPFFQELVWDKGTLDADCFFYFKKDVLEKIELKTLHCHHFQLYSLKQNIKWVCNEMRLQGVWDSLNASSIQLKAFIEEGFLTNGSNQFSHINTELNVEKGYLNPSPISLELEKMNVAAIMEGTNENLSLKGSLTGDLENLVSYLQIPLLQAKKMPFSILFSLHKESDQVSINGDAKLDKLSDVLHYNFKFKDFALDKIFSCLESGHIEAKNVSLDSYSHLWGYDLEGKVDLDARLIKDKMIVSFMGVDSLTFKNSFFELHIPEFVKHKAIFSLIGNTYKLHLKDFSGVLSLLDYKAEILLEKAHLNLENGKAFCEFKKAYCQNAEFSGKATYDFKNDKLECSLPMIAGKAKEYFPYLNKYLSWKMPFVPVEGTLMGSMQFVYEKKCLDLKANIALEKAKIPLFSHLELDEMQADILIDTEKGLFSIENLKSDCLYNQKKLYTIKLPYIKKKESLTSYIFDMEVLKDKLILAHFNGAIEKKEDFILSLDPHLSHLFHSPIHLLDCRIDSKGKLKHFWCKSDLQKNFCTTLTKELENFTDLNLANINFDSLFCEMEMNEKKDGFFHLSSNHFLLENEDLGSLDCIIKKKNEKLILEKLLCQNRCFSGLCLWEDIHRIQISEGRCQSGKEMDFAFSALINLPQKDMLVDVAHMQMTLPLKGSNETFSLPLHGKIHGLGKSHLYWSKKNQRFMHETKFQICLDDITCNTLTIKSLKPVSLSYATNKNLLIKDLSLECTHPLLEEPLKIASDRLSCNEEKKTATLHNCCFSFPQRRLEKLFSKDLTILSSLLHSMVPENLDLEGTLEIPLDRNGLTCEIPKISLVEGKFINNLIFAIDENGLHCDFVYKTQEDNYKLQTEMEFNSDLIGSLSVEGEKSTTFALNWNYKKEEGLIIRTLTGNIPGMRFDFTLDEKRTTLDQMPLIGKIYLDCKKLEKNYPDLYKKIPIFSNLAKHYELKGTLNLPKKNLMSSEFRGTLIGKKVHLADCNFDTLVSRAILNIQGCLLTNLKMSGPDGLLTFNQMKYQFSEGDFIIDSLTAEDLKIRLQAKSLLCIREIKMPQIRGNVYDLQSITGKGEIELTRALKKMNTLAFNTQGMNPQLFIPVKGKIAYQIEEGKIYLTQLDNAYSEKEKSQLLLSTKPKENYIDFQGKLQLHLALKEFGWFRNSEKCNFSVQGSIFDPQILIEKKKGFFSS